MNKNLFVAAALLVLNPQVEAASAVYTYVGNNFKFFTDNTPPSGTYDTSMKVTGSITFTRTLTPGVPVFFDDLFSSLSNFSFSDGRGAISKGDPLGSGSEFLNFQFDGFGNIVSWALTLRDNGTGFPAPTHAISSIRNVLDGGFLGSCTDSTCVSRIFDAGSGLPGVWQRQAAVPLPGALGLLGVGIVSLVNLRRKFRKA